MCGGRPELGAALRFREKGYETNAPKRVLITGANGALGKALRDGLAGAYPVFRLTHRRPLDVPPREGEEFALAQLESLDDMEAAMDGIDTVVHLGARSDEDDWNVIRSANIDGTFNVFEAARRRGVRRVVFGGTHHVVGFHRREHVLGPETPIRPDSRYGVSKAFGEALARMYADKYGIEVVNIRIGVCPAGAAAPAFACGCGWATRTGYRWSAPPSTRPTACTT